MWFVCLSVLCSVAVSVLLRLARALGVDVAQAVTWNYLAAIALCLALLNPPLAALHAAATPWPWLLGLGLLLPALFLVLAASVRVAGIVRTDIAQRLSLLLSLLAAFTLFGERAGGLRLAGLALGLLALPCLLLRPRAVVAGGGTTSVAGMAVPAATPGARAQVVLPLLVLCGFAAVDVALKHIARDGTPLAASLLVLFVTAFVPMLAWQLWRHLSGAARLQARSFGVGLLLGALNFGNILFYLRAHRALPDHPSLVFSAMNIGVVLLGTLVGVLGFGERLGRLNVLAIPLAIAAIAMIAAGAG